MTHLPFDPAFDMPHNREQALAVIKAWGSPSCATFSAERASRVYECLVSDTPSVLPPALSFGRHLGGWAWGHADGWHGGFNSKDTALRAAMSA